MHLNGFLHKNNFRNPQQRHQFSFWSCNTRVAEKVRLYRPLLLLARAYQQVEDLHLVDGLPKKESNETTYWTYFFNIPDSCCAVNCQNRREGKTRNIPFYKIPSKPTPIKQRRRREWIRALRREDWKSWSYEQIFSTEGLWQPLYIRQVL